VINCLDLKRLFHFYPLSRGLSLGHSNRRETLPPAALDAPQITPLAPKSRRQPPPTRAACSSSLCSAADATRARHAHAGRPRREPDAHTCAAPDASPPSPTPRARAPSPTQVRLPLPHWTRRDTTGDGDARARRLLASCRVRCSPLIKFSHSFFELDPGWIVVGGLLL
jgi:hypothetical protein